MGYNYFYRRKRNGGIDFHRREVRSVERKQTSNVLQASHFGLNFREIPQFIC